MIAKLSFCQQCYHSSRNSPNCFQTFKLTQLVKLIKLIFLMKVIYLWWFIFFFCLIYGISLHMYLCYCGWCSLNANKGIEKLKKKLYYPMVNLNNAFQWQTRTLWILCIMLYGLSRAAKRPKIIITSENIKLYFIHTQMPEIVLFIKWQNDTNVYTCHSELQN